VWASFFMQVSGLQFSTGTIFDTCYISIYTKCTIGVAENITGSATSF